MMSAHVHGVPGEETVLQFAGAGAVTVTALAMAGRLGLARLGRRLRRTRETRDES
jgi:NADPH:quinone reductase-like Zn-dependent oxidoreductase